MDKDTTYNPLQQKKLIFEQMPTIAIRSDFFRFLIELFGSNGHHIGADIIVNP